MDKFKSKSPRNQFPTIMVKSANSAVTAIENDDDNVEQKFHFYYAFKPVYLFSRLVGLMPFSIVRSLNGKDLAAQVTILDLIWFIFTICWAIMLAVIDTKNLRLPDDPNESLTINFGDHLLLMIGLTVGTISIAMDMFNRNRLVKIIQKFEMFDTEVAKFGIQVDNNGCHRRGIIWLIVAFVCTVITSLSAFNLYGSIRSSNSTLSMMLFFFAYSFNSLVMATTLTTFVALMMSLDRRCEALKSILRNQFLSGDGNCVSTKSNKENSISIIKFVGRQYAFLTEIMDEINFCYSFQALNYVGICFILTVLTLYSFYRFLLQQNEFFEESSKVHMNRCMFFSSYMNVLIFQGSLTGIQGKKLSKFVHSIINTCNDSEIVQTLDQLCNQISHHYPKATCGFFSFDWKLLFLLTGSSATYLTILVQFDP